MKGIYPLPAQHRNIEHTLEYKGGKNEILS